MSFLPTSCVQTAILDVWQQWGTRQTKDLSSRHFHTVRGQDISQTVLKSGLVLTVVRAAMTETAISWGLVVPANHDPDPHLLPPIEDKHGSVIDKQPRRALKGLADRERLCVLRPDRDVSLCLPHPCSRVFRERCFLAKVAGTHNSCSGWIS